MQQQTKTLPPRSQQKQQEQKQQQSILLHPSITNCVQTLYACCRLGKLHNVISWMKTHLCISFNEVDHHNYHNNNQNNNLCQCPMQGNVELVKQCVSAACEYVIHAKQFHILNFFIEQYLVDERTIVKKMAGNYLFYWVIAKTDDTESIRLFLDLFRKSQYYSIGSKQTAKEMIVHEWFTVACKFARHEIIRFFFNEYRHLIYGHLVLRVMKNNLFTEDHFIADPSLSVFRYLLDELSTIEWTIVMQSDFADMLLTRNCVTSSLICHIEMAVEFMKRYYLTWQHNEKWLKQVDGVPNNWHSAWKYQLQELMIAAASDKKNQVEILNILTRDGNVDITNHQMVVGTSLLERIDNDGHVDNIMWMVEHGYQLDFQQMLCNACTQRRASVVRYVLSTNKITCFGAYAALTVNIKQRNPKENNRIRCPVITRCIVDHHPLVGTLLVSDICKQYFCQEMLAQNMEVLEHVIRVLDEQYQTQFTTLYPNGNIISSYSLETTFALVVLRDIVCRQLQVVQEVVQEESHSKNMYINETQ